MRLSKKLAFACLVLCFVFQFNGCGLLSKSDDNVNSANETKPKEENLVVLEERKQIKSNDIADFKKAVEDLEASQTGLAKKILKADNEPELNEALYAEIDKKCKAVKPSPPKGTAENPPNPSANNSRPPECKKFEDNRKQIGDNKRKLSQAELELKSNNDRIAAIKKQQEEGIKNQDGGLGLLTWLLAGFIGLVFLSGLLGALFFVLKKIKDEQESRIGDVNSIRAEQREFTRQVKELKEAAKLQNERLERQQISIQSLQNQPKESGGDNVARQQEAFHQPPPVFKPEPQFPVAAEDYLNKVRPNAQTATADLIGGVLVQDANKGNEFLIVRDNGLTDGLFYAVPNQTRFNIKGDYLNYYQNYYNCDNPSGGMVWIKSPTTVRRVDGGWQLVEKGELEIK